jgi:hypothetical protein
MLVWGYLGEQLAVGSVLGMVRLLVGAAAVARGITAGAAGRRRLGAHLTAHLVRLRGFTVWMCCVVCVGALACLHGCLVATGAWLQRVLVCAYLLLATLTVLVKSCLAGSFS